MLGGGGGGRPWCQLSRTPAVSQARVGPSPQVGEHTVQVLTEYGFSAAEIAALAAPASGPGQGKGKAKAKAKSKL